MSIFATLVKGAAQLAQVGTQAAAYSQMEKKARRKGGKKGDEGLEGCTPCAAKKRGAEAANSIWK